MISNIFSGATVICICTLLNKHTTEGKENRYKQERMLNTVSSMQCNGWNSSAIIHPPIVSVNQSLRISLFQVCKIIFFLFSLEKKEEEREREFLSPFLSMANYGSRDRTINTLHLSERHRSTSESKRLYLRKMMVKCNNEEIKPIQHTC